MSYTPPFMSPTGPGRPRDEVDLELRIDNFSDGIDVGFDSMATRGFTKLLVNAVSSKRRTLDRRPGFVEVGGDAGDKVWMGGSLQVFNGDDINLKIVNDPVGGVKLQYDNAGTWTDVGAGISGASNRSDWFGSNAYIGENRLYFCNGVDTLRYTTGTAYSTVTDTADIKAKYITTLENVLVLGHFTEIFGPNDIAFAKAGTHQFRRDEDTSFATSSNIISLDGEVTQLKAFNWLVYAFTRGDGLWEVDLNTGVPRRISTHGTPAPKSVAIGEDTMVWADQGGVWGVSSGGGPIEELSEPIQELYENVDAANLLNMNAGISPAGDYHLYVGDVIFDGETFSDCTFVYHIRESRRVGKHKWSIQTGKPANYWWNHTNDSGVTNLHFGSIDSGQVYLNDSGTDDAGETIPMQWVSADFPLASEKQEVTMMDIYIRYRPAASPIPLIASYRRDMGSWTEFDAKSLTLPIGTDGLAFARVSVPSGMAGRTLAVKLTSNSSVATRIYEILITRSFNESDIPLS